VAEIRRMTDLCDVGGSPIQGMMVFTPTEEHNINLCRVEQFRTAVERYDSGAPVLL
jgi:hypothetical protein